MIGANAKARGKPRRSGEGNFGLISVVPATRLLLQE